MVCSTCLIPILELHEKFGEAGWDTPGIPALRAEAGGSQVSGSLGLHSGSKVTLTTLQNLKTNRPEATMSDQNLSGSDSILRGTHARMTT